MWFIASDSPGPARATAIPWPVHSLLTGSGAHPPGAVSRGSGRRCGCA
ncbi:hypothetical protein HMPREF0682_0664 [Propionibacterium acidifaciens F0233]|uniref:Uncharacterized protein n=1 Tax=Propionibacterium acidifaciens F0233 TaxID=553198 RepID=U2Q1Z7_9ACTN|nr:hypothetical protein HMPREF0682_0664 [Propionibacterium acidifaciens F0233]